MGLARSQRRSRERGVPDLHRGRAAVVTKDVQRRGVEQEMLTGARRKSNPSRDQNSKHVAMGEESNVARRGVNPGDDLVYSRPDLVRALAARTAVPEDHPPRSLQMDLLGGESLVITVVPFLQVGLERRARAEARQLTGFPRSTEGARQDELERLLDQNWTQTPRERPTVLGERNIGRSGVLPAQAPLSFTVADHEDALRAGHHGSSLGPRSKVSGGVAA